MLLSSKTDLVAIKSSDKGFNCHPTPGLGPRSFVVRGVCAIYGRGHRARAPEGRTNNQGTGTGTIVRRWIRACAQSFCDRCEPGYVRAAGGQVMPAIPYTIHIVLKGSRAFTSVGYRRQILLATLQSELTLSAASGHAKN